MERAYAGPAKIWYYRNMGYKDKTIGANSVDGLVQKGIYYIRQNGNKIWTSSGPALQTNNVTYVLYNSYNRVHTLRAPTSIKYFARELFAYLVGSLNVSDGLSDASRYWDKLADDNGLINSNYGYYVFHQRTSEGKSQLQWVRENILENAETRQAIININGIQHKKPTKDFPCTIGLVFHLDNNNILNLDVASRSTDVITGLPYDIGFFAFVLELLAKLLSSDLSRKIEVGYTAMHAFFTQIYDRTADKISVILSGEMITESQRMPEIIDAEEVLLDIYQIKDGSPKSEIIKWIIQNKE